MADETQSPPQELVDPSATNHSEHPQYPGILKDFLTARKKSDQAKQYEIDRHNKGKKPWMTYESGLAAYGSMGIDVKKIAEEQKQGKEHVYAMDVMGQGAFFKDLPIDGGVSLTLSDLRRPEQRAYDSSHNIQMIADSVFNGTAWKGVNDYIEKNKGTMNGGFDVITCIPFGGQNMAEKGHLPDELTWQLLNKLYESLSPNNGTLAVVWSFKNDGEFRKKLESTPGINIVTNEDQRNTGYGQPLVIEKTPQAPAELPTP